jgi:DNA-binding NarL/FixJ family response regulator
MAGAVTATVQVVLGDERRLFRGSLVRLLATAPDLEVIDEAGTIAAVTEAVVAGQPDVLAIHVGLLEALTPATAALPALFPSTPTVVYGFPGPSPLVRGALHAGVRGLVDLEAGVDTLVTSIQVVAQGGLIVSPALARNVVGLCSARLPAAHGEPRREREQITNRETEILALIARGSSNRAIADLIGVSENTVRAHLRSLSRKLGVHNRLQAVSVAISTGLIGSAALGPVSYEQSRSGPAWSA